MFMVLMSSLLIFSNNSSAKTITVKNQEEVDDVINNLTEDTTIKFRLRLSEDEINIELDSPYVVTVDGENKQLQTFIKVNLKGESKMEFKNMLFDGNLSSEYRDLGVNLYYYNSNANVVVKDSVFKNIKDQRAAPLTADNDGGKLLVSNVLMENNETEYSGGISGGEGAPEITVENSTFITKRDVFQFAKAIFISDTENDIKIKNSKFIQKEKGNDQEDTISSAIVISGLYNGASLTIDSSIFDGYNRKVDRNSTRFEDESSGSVISISGYDYSSKILVENSTFSNNRSEGGASVIGIVAQNDEEANSDVNISNSTFYNNESVQMSKVKPVGTILLNGEDELEKGKYIGNNNTFYKNKYNNDGVLIKRKGSLLNAINAPKAIELKNELFVGNFEENDDRYANIYINSQLDLTQMKSLGFDNGAVFPENEQDVYGKYPVTLIENSSKVKAGRIEDAEVIKTIPIAPIIKGNDGKLITGLANEYGGKILKKDQRGFTRKGQHDSGAVEISSVVYDASGGNFTLPKLTKYDGKTYYEGEKPKQYAKVLTPGSKTTIIDGMKVLKPKKEGLQFKGWTTKKNGKIPDTKYSSGKQHIIDDQLILYAVWGEKKYSVLYHGNGKTIGSVPTQKQVALNTNITVKNIGKTKRKGYTFTGWSLKASSKKADPKLVPGKKCKIIGNTKIYAIWKRK